MAVKTGISSLSEGRSDLLKIDPRKLHIKSGWNTRDMNSPDNIEHVDMLAKSIAEVGVKVPLKAYWEDGKAWVTSGHCRHAAAIRAIEVYKADLKTVPVQIEDRYGNEADRLFGQIVDNQGKPFTSLEQAKVFKKLIDLGWQQNDIAKKAGITASRVSQILDLLTMPEGVKAMVIAGNVSPTMAMQTVKEQGATAAETALKAGLEAAKAEGKTKVKPSHMEPAQEPSGSNWEPAQPVKVNLRTLIKEVLDATDVNDSGEDEVILTMSNETWKKLRDGVDW